MKAFASKAAVGLLWFVGFTIATNVIVRPAVRKLTASAGVPQLGEML